MLKIIANAKKIKQQCIIYTNSNNSNDTTNLYNLSIPAVFYRSINLQNVLSYFSNFQFAGRMFNMRS